MIPLLAMSLDEKLMDEVAGAVVASPGASDK